MKGLVWSQFLQLDTLCNLALRGPLLHMKLVWQWDLRMMIFNLQFVIFPDHTHLLYFMLPSNVDPLDLQEEDELAQIIDGIFLILQMENFSFKKLALKIIIVQSPALSLRWSKRRGNQFLFLNLH